MQIGEVVKAVAGKEKNGIYVVIDYKDGFAYLADGKRLKFQKPKKKSVKHLQKYGTQKFPQELLAVRDEKVNAAIREFLKSLKEV